jgi:hypothetical protein
MKIIIDDTLFWYKLHTKLKNYLVKSMNYNYFSI